MRPFLPIMMAALALPAIADKPDPVPVPAAPVPLVPAEPLLPQPDARAPLGLDEAQRLALENQPQLEARQTLVTEARQNAVAAGELPDPRLRFGVVSVPIDTFDLSQEPMTQGVIGVTQTFPGGDKRRLSADRLLRQAEQGEAALESTRRRIRREAGLAWLGTWYPTRSLQWLRRIEREYQRQIDWARAALSASKVTQEETLALRVMHEYVQDRKAELARNEARARASLARWVGDAAHRALPEDLPEIRLGADTRRNGVPEPAGAAALDRHPELEILRRAEAVARAEADLAREAYKPDWNVDLSYGARGANRPDFVSAVASVDLPLFTEKRQDMRLAAKLAALARAQSELADRRRQLAADLAGVQADWDAANARIAHFESRLIPLAEQRVQSALAGYSAGKSGFVTVLDARRAELEARIRLLEQQMLRARAAIEIGYFLD